MHETLGQRKIRDISCPEVVRPIDSQPFEQVCVDLAPIARNAGSWVRIHGSNAHGANQPLHPLPVDPATLVLQVNTHHASCHSTLFRDAADQSDTTDPGPPDSVHEGRNTPMSGSA